MRTLKFALITLLLLHLLAAGAGVGWLILSGRVSTERIAEIKETFQRPVAEEKARQEEQKEKAKQLQAEAERAERLSQLGEASTTADRLAEANQRNEILLRQLERTRSEIQALQQNLHLARQRLERQNEQVHAANERLEQRLAEIEQRFNDEGFKKAVTLYESLPAEQVKAMFTSLMEDGRTEQVVAYLEAMQPRIAAKVLKEFERGADVQRAVNLTERLRARGSDIVAQVENAG